MTRNMNPCAPRALIINADDFGADSKINAAVELAARAGTLSCASLMVGGSAAADAVDRAHRLPQLRVGLHLTLIDGLATLTSVEIPLLVGAQRRFRGDMVAYSIRAFADRRVRGQLRAEIRAQFAAFAATGLRLDHVNTHKHFHMHPTLLEMILEIGANFGMHSLRIPNEPLHYVWRESPSMRPALGNTALKPLLARMKRRLAARGIRHCDQVFGILWSGALTKTRLLAVLADLPAGKTEIYLHPTLESAELEGLLSPEVAAALAHQGLVPRGYSDLIDVQS